MAENVRLLVASDLLLGRPLRGLTEWPEEATDNLIDAPYDAAERIFTTALERSLPAILLIGQVLEPKGTSPRAHRFLFDQCRRVAKQQIDVLWVEGPQDRWDEWPASLPVPDNLHRISRHATQPFLWPNQTSPRFSLIQLASRRHASPTATDAPAREMYRIGYLPDASKLESLDRTDELDCVVLGGRGGVRETDVQGTPAVAAGLHQPRSPGQSAPGVALELQLRPDRVTWQSVPVATVRFAEETVRFETAPKLESLRDRLGERALDLVAQSEGNLMIVRWLVEVPAGDFPEFDAARLSREVTRWLRDEFCSSSSKVWSYRVEFRVVGQAPTSWREEDSILGDFLRGLHELEHDERALTFPEVQGLDQRLVRELLETPPAGRERERLLARVHEVGLRMLRGEESPS